VDTLFTAIGVMGRKRLPRNAMSQTAACTEFFRLWMRKWVRCPRKTRKTVNLGRPATTNYIAVMNRSEAVNWLKGCADAVKARGATSLYLFGSAVRDEARAGSDFDLFIDYDLNKKFSLVDLVGIKLLLEDAFGVDVDLTTRDSLHPMLRKDIERSAVRVF
jgi:predicted nucleotidyltransferase